MHPHGFPVSFNVDVGDEFARLVELGALEVGDEVYTWGSDEIVVDQATLNRATAIAAVSRRSQLIPTRKLSGLPRLYWILEG